MATRMSVVPRDSYVVARERHSGRRGSITLSFDAPRRPTVVRFGKPESLWSPPVDPAEFLLEASADGKNFERVVRSPARPLLKIQDLGSIRALRITEVAETESKRWLDNRVSVLAR